MFQMPKGTLFDLWLRRGRRQKMRDSPVRAVEASCTEMGAPPLSIPEGAGEDGEGDKPLSCAEALTANITTKNIQIFNQTADCAI
nr:hypothetical protein Iba_chr04bCG9600 [Ipomoea batatas]